MKFFASMAFACCLFNCYSQSAAPEPVAVSLYDLVKCTPVRDQQQSPTCWVFGTNSLFESDLIKMRGLELNLSEMFIARYAYLEKAQTFLATKGKTYFEGGGQFHDVIRIIERHGLMPEFAYTGRQREQLVHNHKELDSSFQHYVKRLLERGDSSLTHYDRQQLNDTLDKYLGKLPADFEFNGKRYTARTFADSVVHFNNDYVEVVSFADHPWYRRFELVDKYNWARDSFYNVPLEDLLAIVDTALHKGWSVGWEGDVTEPGFRYFAGIASMADSVRRYDEERLENYKSEATERDHMLHIVGAGRDDSNRTWYYMKNSWGTFSRHKGYLYMERNYFRMKTVILCVNKRGLPESIRKKLKIK